MAHRPTLKIYLSGLQRYWLYFLAILIGLALPILTTLMTLTFGSQPVTLETILQVQISNPILWLVDFAAIVWIILMLLGVLREQKNAQRVSDLQMKIAERIGELYNLKEIYHREIQTRQLAEINNSRAKREWETTFDAIHDLILITDADGKIIRCNRATIQKLESSYSVTLGRPIEEVFPGVVEPIQKRVINKTQVIQMPSKFGWFDVTGFQFQSLDDKPGMIYIFRDIADRKRNEAELQRQKQYFEAIFHHSPVAIVTLDLKNRIVTSNPAFEYLFGFSPVEASGRKLDDLILPSEHRDKTYEYTRRIRQTDVHHDVSKRQTKAGILVDVEVFTVPVVVKGEPLGTLVLFHNITDLEQARRKAEEADLAKSEYLANISHEIRTPLNGLIGLLDMTLDTALSSTQAEYLSTAADQAEELLSLLNEILDLSKIEAGRMQLESTPFNLRLVVEKVALTMAQRASEKGVELVCIVPPSIPTRLVGDPSRLRQVLSNLTANAVKFTDQGEIVISVRQIADAGFETSLAFSVQDTGIGIPADRQAAIFDRFTQADQSTPRKYGGTGLGLSISAQIVQLMGGKLSLVSEPGIGSIFSFTVAFEKQAENEPPPDALLNLTRGESVLVVDNNPNNQLNLKLLFEELDCQVNCTAGTGDALTLIEQADEPFVIMVVESQLAAEQDFAFLREIQQTSTNQPFKVLITCQMGDKIEDDQLDELGIGAVVLKPIRRQPLHHALYDLLAPDKNMSTTSPAPSKSRLGKLISSSPQRILLAEDNLTNRKVITNLLEKFGHTVTAVGNGRQAVAAFRSDGYNLVLLDVQMPGLDGHEAVTRIRHMEGQSHHTPVIALSGHSSEMEIQQCISSGMDDCLSKPVRPQELFNAVEEWARPIPQDRPWLRQSKDDMVIGAPVVEPSVNDDISDQDFAEFSSAFDQLVLTTDKPLSSELAGDYSAGQTSNLKKPGERNPSQDTPYSFGSTDYLQNILPRFGDDLSFFINTFEEFALECRSYINQIHHAVEQKDAAVVRLLAHNLKGAAANFEITNLVDDSQEIELRAGRGIYAQAKKLAAAIERTIPEMEKYLDEVRAMLK